MLIQKTGLANIALHPWIKEGRAAKTDEIPTHDFCEIFEPMFPSSNITRLIDSHALFHGFTFAYLMFGNSLNTLSPGGAFLIIYAVLIIIDMIYRTLKNCTDFIYGVLPGILIGAIFGFLWFLAVINIFNDGRQLVFFGIDPSVSKCKINSLSNKTYKCTQTPVG